MCSKNMDVEQIVAEIRSVHINLATMHPSEYQHIARIFFAEIMENGWYGLDEVQKVLDELNYPDNIKDNIFNIAEVIQKIKDQPETVGRYTDSYKRVMSRFK